MEVKMEYVTNDNNHVIDTEVEPAYFPIKTSFFKFLTPCKSFQRFQKIVQLFDFI